MHAVFLKCTSFEANALFLTADRPVFTRHPQSQVDKEGSDVNFSCAADASSFVWIKDGCELSLGGRISVSEDKKILRIMDVNRTDSGEYICEATNNEIKVKSNAATLTIQCKGTFTHFILKPNCWFSHDVTKIQTKKISILQGFYIHDALEQMKTNVHTNFHFKRVLGFVIEYA